MPVNNRIGQVIIKVTKKACSECKDSPRTKAKKYNPASYVRLDKVTWKNAHSIPSSENSESSLSASCDIIIWTKNLVIIYQHCK